jgi:N-methylhydantoinase B
MVGEKMEAMIQRTVIANRLDSITQEMGLVLERSAHSPIFAEACDFACCICDHKGTLVSQLSGIPILATAGSYSVISVLNRYKEDINPGDVFIINDPYHGGNHLPDIGIITPVFHDERLMFFCVSRAHHGDIGGSTAGSYNPKATEIFQEGIRIPPTRIIKQHAFLTEVLELILINTRNPQMLKSDLQAQIGANKVALKRIGDMIETYGPDGVAWAVDELLELTEALTRKRIAALPDGVYQAMDYVDDDGFQEEPIHIAVTINVEGDRLLVDFDGTHPQVKGFINTSVVTATAAAGIAVLWMLGADIPRNGGAFRCIDVHLPKGSLVNPYEPAPMTLCTLTPAGEIIATILQALDQAVEGEVPAGYGRYAGPSFYGTDPRTERYYVGFSFCSLGSGGASKDRDGKPYMATLSNYGGVKTPNIESNEVQYPHVTLYHELDTDTAGAGTFRGGSGMKYAYQFYDEAGHIVNFGDGMKFPPYGLHRGHPGSLNRGLLVHDGVSIPLQSKEAPRSTVKGDRVELYSSGGGGWGDPLDRVAQQVYCDVLDEIITQKTAEEVYGVVITQDGVDEEMTLKTRDALRQLHQIKKTENV